MNLIPNPLHPALVHFPIVLLLLGTVAAVVAAVWRKHHLPVLAAALLAMGALGTWAAVASGESDGGLIENASPQLNSLVDAHETWAKRTLTISILAAVAAGGAVLTARWPGIARAVAIVAALASVAPPLGFIKRGIAEEPWCIATVPAWKWFRRWRRHPRLPSAARQTEPSEAWSLRCLSLHSSPCPAPTHSQGAQEACAQQN